MNKIKWLAGIVILASIGYLFVGQSTNSEKAPQAQSYQATLEQERKAKDRFFQQDKDSPIEDKASFTGLHYYPVNEAWNIEATLTRLRSGQQFSISMTGGETETYEPYGNVNFEKDGKKVSLKIFINKEGVLFLPFKDATSGKDTYGAGRYLDLDQSSVHDNHIHLDFNRAYQPYCAYNHTFTCPIPPAENFIPLAVTAGEKL